MSRPLRAALTTSIVVAAALGTVTSASASPVPTTPTAPHKPDRTTTRVLESARSALAAPQDEVVLVATVARGTDVDKVADLAERGSGTVAHELTALRRVSVRVPRTQAAAATRRLNALPGVTQVGRAAERRFFEVPNDVDYAASQAHYLGVVAAPAAWSRTHGTAETTVAVLDSGVDLQHPDLAGKIAGVYNAHSDSTAPGDMVDSVGHGTFVAGVAAAATNNRTGVAGIGYDTSVLAVKVDQPDPSSPGDYAISGDDVARGIVWATDHGADVINLSFGSPVQDSTESAAIAYAVNKGVLVVASAGNEPNTTKNYPAADDGVVSVGATDAAGSRASFSTHGDWVTIGAPGVAIRSTTPRAGGSLFAKPNYDTADGTSFSAPLVAGAAALVRSTYPGASLTQLRDALTSSADHDADLDLGAGQLNVNGALDALRPTSTPGTPTVEGNAGRITFRVITDAPKAQFTVDGVAQTAVAANGNPRTAILTYSTYGSANGPHTVSAADCTAAASCTESGPAADFSVDNLAPTLTAPAAGARISGGFTFSATTSGGGVAFLVDGNRVAFDGSAPYSQPYTGSALAEGAHLVSVQQCDATGTRCSGPASDAVEITSDSLHPSIVSLTPSPFSPNADRVRDTTTLTYSLTETQSVRATVLDAAGTVVRNSAALGTKAKGRYAWTWNGRGNGNRALGTGTYTVVLDTSVTRGGVVVSGQVSRGLLLDITAPSFSSIVGNRTEFFPYKDGYRDVFTPSAHLSERSSVYLQIRDSKNRLVRSVGAVRNAGPISLPWNGTNSAGRGVANGTYRWQFIAVDGAGTRRATPFYSVVRSGKKLVTKTAVLTRNGNAGRFYGPNCTEIDRSDFAAGTLMWNFCDDADLQLIVGFFPFTLPAAVTYSSLTLSATGYSFYTPTQLVGSFDRTDGEVDLGSTAAVTTRTVSAYSLGSVTAAGHVTASRQVTAGVSLTNYYDYPSDFDVKSVSLKVVYRVLQ